MDQFDVAFPGPLRQIRKRRFERMLARIVLLVGQRLAGDTCEEQFQVVDGRRAMRVLLRDRLPLLGQSQIPLQGLVGQRLDETIRRPSTSTDGATATMEETDAYPMRFADFDKFLLGSSQMYQAGQDAPVLVAVAIADHHLPDRRNRIACTNVPSTNVASIRVTRLRASLDLHAPLGDWVLQKGVVNRWAVLQIVDGFE